MFLFTIFYIFVYSHDLVGIKWHWFFSRFSSAFFVFLPTQHWTLNSQIFCCPLMSLESLQLSLVPWLSCSFYSSVLGWDAMLSNFSTWHGSRQLQLLGSVNHLFSWNTWKIVRGFMVLSWVKDLWPAPRQSGPENNGNEGDPHSPSSKIRCCLMSYPGLWMSSSFTIEH